MKKIGFIDHYLNNFHADKYLKLIRSGKFAKEFDVAYAYGEADWDGVGTAKWCEDNKVEMAASPEEVVEKSDFVLVLSPNNPEHHFRLAEAALKSGKRTYIDKTFAPDLKTAVDMIKLAKQHNTPMFSTSALRFVPEIMEYKNSIGIERATKAVSVRGPSTFEVYAVHHFEPLTMLLGHGAKSISFFGNNEYLLFNVQYDDGRIGGTNQYEPSCAIGNKWCGHPFEASILFEGGATAYRFTCDNMFADLVDAICEFYSGGESPAPFEDTLEVMALIDAGAKAMKSPGEWIKVPEYSL